MLEISQRILIFCGNCNKLLTNVPLFTHYVSFSAPRLKIYTNFSSDELFFIPLIVYDFFKALPTSSLLLWAKNIQAPVTPPNSMCSAISVFSETHM